MTAPVRNPPPSGGGSIKQFAYLDNQTIMAGASLWGSDPVTVEDMETDDHPNAMPFEGVLLRVDEPSNKPPGGAQGHRIMVPKAVAEKLLPTLVGMGVNFSSEFDHHEPQKKIGVITSAWVSGRDVKVKGIIYSRDFPNAAKAIHAKSKTSSLGMSMELADIWVEDRNSQVWKLDDFKFTGGTILSKSAAAYHRTSLAASGLKRYYVQALAAAGVVVEGKLPLKGERKMAKRIVASASNPTEDKRKRVLRAMAAAAAAGVSANLGGTLARMEKTMATQTYVLKGMLAAIKTLPKPKSLVAKGRDVSAAAEEEDELSAAKKDASADPSMDPSGDDVSAAAQDEDELNEAEGEEEDELSAAKRDASADPSGADVSAAAEEEDELEAFDSGDEHGESDASDEEPGEVNQAARKHAKKHAKEGVSASSDRRLDRAIRALTAAASTVDKTNKKFDELSHENKKLRKRVSVMQAQVEAASRRTTRATLPPEAFALLAKGGINVSELQASGEKLTVAKVDQVLSADPNLRLDAATRMGIKNALLQQGLMEDGAIQN